MSNRMILKYVHEHPGCNHNDVGIAGAIYFDEHLNVTNHLRDLIDAGAIVEDGEGTGEGLRVKDERCGVPIPRCASDIKWHWQNLPNGKPFYPGIAASLYYLDLGYDFDGIRQSAFMNENGKGGCRGVFGSISQVPNYWPRGFWGTP